MPHHPNRISPRPFTVRCADDVMLAAHMWSKGEPSAGTVIVNPATGSPARYYHRYAAFLARHGFDVITYDYRGIGGSAPARLKGCGFRWRDWGEKDFDAVLRFVAERGNTGPLMVVGHSFGGFLPGLSESGHLIDRMLTVGAQFGHWPDYATRAKAQLFLKWHVVMPALTALCGYFPGKALGWSQDLPAGVANDWARQPKFFEHAMPAGRREDVLRRLASVRAQILAIALSDDPIAPPRAVLRALSYFTGARSIEVFLTPGDLYRRSIGHLGLFHESQSSDFWIDTLVWLREGCNPWPDRPFPLRRASGIPGCHVDIVRYY